ncbi:MAG TPA: hypothetical protein VI386_30560 [Candidatus Sulfotelmatobacter sp.]
MTNESKIRFIELQNKGDARGLSFAAPAEALEYVDRMADVHLASTKPGEVRGNHYHLKRREAIIVLPGPKWSFHWDEGDGTAPQHQEFDGGTAVLILVAVDSSHALRNEGNATLWWLGISSEAYDPAESVARKVL